MNQVIQVTIDDQGRIIIPATVWERLGLSQGMTLIVEHGREDEVCLRIQEETPVLVDKHGVLVAEVESLAELAAVTKGERDRRLSDLLRRAAL